MHSHQGFQEQRLMAAPLVIHDARDQSDSPEIVLMLADFSFTPAEEIFARLRKNDTMANMKSASDRSGAVSVVPEMSGMIKNTIAAPDLNDVKYDAFLANDRTLSDPEVVRVDRGGRVLLRVINGSSMSSYHLDLGALEGELIAVDGFAIKPITARRFPISVAQRLDIRLVIPKEPAAFPVLAFVQGERNRTGIVLRTGNAPIRRITEKKETAAPALTLELERRLQASAPLPQRIADRVHRIDLTGKMAGYVWSLNHVAWTPDTPPLPISKGERVELVLTNRTPMSHPMQLHGHEFQIVEIGGQRFTGAVRDTILVPPMERVVVAFDANNPGKWAFHCHMLYHMAAGMFTTFRYV